jgi:ACT domain-containing protein
MSQNFSKSAFLKSKQSITSFESIDKAQKFWALSMFFLNLQGFPPSSAQDIADALVVVLCTNF